MPKRFVTVYTIPEVSKQGFTLTVQPCQEGVHFERNKPIRFQAVLTKDGTCHHVARVSDTWRHYMVLPRPEHGVTTISTTNVYRGGGPGSKGW